MKKLYHNTRIGQKISLCDAECLNYNLHRLNSSPNVKQYLGGYKFKNDHEMERVETRLLFIQNTDYCQQEIDKLVPTT
jgi:hypothetical protein